jgi:biopolymer transport protein ExbB
MSDYLTFFVVKGTLALLGLASALTWAVIVVKAVQQFSLAAQNRAFTRSFAQGASLPPADDIAKQRGPAARVAIAGVESWEESAESTDDEAATEVRRDLLERSLRQQVQRERRGFEVGLPILASIGSTAPFVGLFGTVFGIIHALQRISGAGSASLDVVAGPIGEALVATGIGIAVAVPAVLAYNFFVRRLKNLLADLEDFSSVLVNKAVKSTFRTRRRLTSDSGAQPASGRLDLRREAST